MIRSIARRLSATVRALGPAAVLALAACAPPAGAQAQAQTPTWIGDTSTSFRPGGPDRPPGGPGRPPAGAAGSAIARDYGDAAARIIAAARADRAAYAKLAHLTDRIGNRLSGSAALDRAIAWAAQAM